MKDTIPLTIDGIAYVLDITAAKNLGVLVENYPLNPGDVYTDPKNDHNPVLLVKVLYKYPDTGNDFKAFQLLGLGAGPNSGHFFEELHTKAEIKDYLRMQNLRFARNIEPVIRAEVNYKTR